MSNRSEQDWNPLAAQVLRDPRAAFDAMRERCPVAYSELLGWSLFRHEDVVRVLNDPATFSSVVSRNLSVPNGMDPPAHGHYRSLIEPFFAAGPTQSFEPQVRSIASDLVRDLQARAQPELELMGDFAHPFAVQVQCAFLGWPARMHEPLRRWGQKNHAATLAHDREAMARIAEEFAGYVAELLHTCRSDVAPGDAQAMAARQNADVTASLARLQVQGRALEDAEIVSILRNWTVGEVGTLASALGIVASYLAQHPQVQSDLRTQPAQLPAAVEEILRLYGPLLANRRVTTRAVEIGGRSIAAGERISLNWVSANRDDRAFPEAQAFRPERDASANLLYGTGIHVCPGAPLARMELRVALQALLEGTQRIEPSADQPPVHAVFPASGFAQVPLRMVYA